MPNIIGRIRKRYSPFIRWKNDLTSELESAGMMAETAKGSIEYVIHGESGPFVSVMHGSPGGYDQASALFHDFFDKGFRILSWSRPGYLRTPLKAGVTFEDQADCFAALLDTLGIKQTAVFAYSAGGPPAVFFAAAYPERIRSLILECAVTGEYEVNPGNIREQIFFGHLMFHDPALWLSDIITAHVPWLAGRSAIKMESSLDEEDVWKVLRHIMHDESRQKLLMSLIRSMSPSELREKGMKNDLKQLSRLKDLPLGQVKTPTLVIHGSDDFDVPLVHARRAVQLIPGAEFYLVAGGFHIMALCDAAHEVTQRRLAFLDKYA